MPTITFYESDGTKHTVSAFVGDSVMIAARALDCSDGNFSDEISLCFVSIAGELPLLKFYIGCKMGFILLPTGELGIEYCYAFSQVVSRYGEVASATLLFLAINFVKL